MPIGNRMGIPRLLGLVNVQQSVDPGCLGVFFFGGGGMKSYLFLCGF